MRLSALGVWGTVILGLACSGSKKKNSGDGNALSWSRNADRSSAMPLDGQILSGNAFVFVTPSEKLAKVTFFVDAKPVAARIDSEAPFDLVGGSADAADSFDTLTLADGAHTLDAKLEFVSGGPTTLHAAFSV